MKRAGVVSLAALAIALGVGGGVAAASGSSGSSVSLAKSASVAKPALSTSPTPGSSATSASPAGLSVRAGSLVLSRAAQQYTGTLQVTVRNNSKSPMTDGTLTIKVPAGLRFVGLTGESACVGDLTDSVSCGLNSFAAGERRTIAVNFGSFAGPERFARVTERGTVTVTGGGSTAASKYAGILKSTSGSARHPRPYRPSTDYDLVLRAGGEPVVTRDASGVSVRLPLVAKDRTDAINSGGTIGVTVNGSTIIPSVDPSAPCTSLCPVPGTDWLAAGESRSFAVLFTLPADTPAGTYVVQIHGDMNAGTGTPPADLTPQNNTVVFTVTVPAA